MFEHNWNGDVGMKRHDLAVFQMKDTATRGAHLPSCRGNYTFGQIKIAPVSAIESQFDDNDVAGGVEIYEIPVHIRKRGRVVVNSDADILPVVFLSSTHVVEVPAVTEHGHER